MSGCGGCGCLFINPPPSPTELARLYPARYWRRTRHGLLQTLEYRYRRLALRDHVAFVRTTAKTLPESAKPAPLLDVGCGTGLLLRILRERGMLVRGFDSSPEAAEIARVENGLDVVVGSALENAGFENNEFQMVTLFHVLEHVPEPQRLLAEIRRILAEGGRLVVQVPNIESWQFKWWKEQWYGLDVPRHVINYSEQSLRRLLSDAGFTVRRTRHFNLRDNAPAFASSLFPFLDPVSRDVRQRSQMRAESRTQSWVRHGVYALAVAAAYPVVIAESLAGAGATLMIEAGKNER